MDITDLTERVSAPVTSFTGEAPAPADLPLILQAGMSAPDHGGLQPWRYLTVAGAARERLGDLFADALREDDPETSESALATARSRPLRAPVIVVVIAAQTPDLAVPVDEQFLAAGASAHQLVLAATALGYGAVWLSGPFSYHPRVRRGLGVDDGEKIAGLVYLGTVEDGALERRRAAVRRADAATVTTAWTGPVSCSPP